MPLAQLPEEQVSAVLDLVLDPAELVARVRPKPAVERVREPCYDRSHRRRVVVDPHAAVERRRARGLNLVVEQAGMDRTRTRTRSARARAPAERRTVARQSRVSTRARSWLRLHPRRLLIGGVRLVGVGDPAAVLASHPRRRLVGERVERASGKVGGQYLKRSCEARLVPGPSGSRRLSPSQERPVPRPRHRCSSIFGRCRGRATLRKLGQSQPARFSGPLGAAQGLAHRLRATVSGRPGGTDELGTRCVKCGRRPRSHAERPPF